MSKLPAVISLAAIGSFCLETVAFSAPFLPGIKATNADVPSLVQNVHGCHANTRYNYVEEIDDEARHRHRGDNCRALLVDSGSNSHCHADGRKHRHRSYGSKVHSHFGNSCRVDVWEQRRNNGNSDRGCIKVGIVTFCP